MLKIKGIRGDLFGGITAGVVALPLALAFGVQSGLGASAGIYGAIFLGIFAAMFGGTPLQVSGPTGPMTVVTASIVALSVQQFGTLEQALPSILITFILAGIFQIVFGIIKLGKYIRYIPYPVLSGFMSGIGIIIIILQIFPLLGQVSPAKTLDAMLNFPGLLSDYNLVALGFSAGTIFIIYVFPLMTKKIPSTLVALIAMTIIYFFSGLEIPVIGDIPAGFPKLQFGLLGEFSITQLSLIVFPALTLAGLGTIDTLLTSVVADNLTKTQHNSNKELIGQGIGNAIAGFFGGIPGAGATMRTVVNIRSGSKTKISGIIHGILLLLILLGLGSLVKHIPLAVLAAVLVSVGISIIDYKGLKDIVHIPRADAVVLILVLVITVFVDLLQAVGLGMIIASLLFMKRASDLVDSGTHLAPLSKTDQELPWADEGDITEDMLSKIYIQRLDGPLFFGSVTRFQQKMMEVPDHVKVVIIRMRKVPFMDQSGLYAMEEAILSLQAKGITVAMTIIQPQPLYMMTKIKLIPGLIPENLTFPTFEACAAWLKEYLTKG